MEIGSVVIYKGDNHPVLVKGNSYIIDYIINDSNPENNHPYFYLKDFNFDVFDSFYFTTIKEYRKMKLEKLNNGNQKR